MAQPDLITLIFFKRQSRHMCYKRLAILGVYNSAFIFFFFIGVVILLLFYFI
jgi:hypothetical protein